MRGKSNSIRSIYSDSNIESCEYYFRCIPTELASSLAVHVCAKGPQQPANGPGFPWLLFGESHHNAGCCDISEIGGEEWEIAINSDGLQQPAGDPGFHPIDAWFHSTKVLAVVR